MNKNHESDSLVISITKRFKDLSSKQIIIWIMCEPVLTSSKYLIKNNLKVFYSLTQYFIVKEIVFYLKSGLSPL